MTPTVVDAGPFEKLVRFTLSEEELEEAKTAAARRLAKDLKIKGFRPGKAPRPIVEATVGRERLRSEAIEEALPAKLGEALAEVDLRPAVTPSLESVDEGQSGVDVEVRVTLWPTLEDVPEYRDRTVEVGSPDVTEEEVEAQIERMRDQFAQVEVVDRPAAEGDYVTIDIGATYEGEPVEEAAAHELLYEVGSGGFIEGIDEVLVGASAGDQVAFEGRLPQGFGDKAGLEVTFVVDVRDVRAKVLPDLTDEWVSEVTEFETVDELRDALAERLGLVKRRRLQALFRERALAQLVDEVTIELPDALVRAEMDEVLHRFAHRLEEQGISLEDYFQVTGQDRQAFVDDLRAQAERNLRTRLLLEAVAADAGLEVSDEELDEVVSAIAARTEEPEAFREAFAGSVQEQSLIGDILRSKALDAIVAGATPTDEEGRPVDLTIPDEDEHGSADGGDDLEEGVVEAEVVEPRPAETGIVEAEIMDEQE